MRGYVTLRTDELHLVQAIIGKGPVLNGLEQFAMSEDRKPGEKEKQALLEKEILRRKEDRFYLDPAAGHAFTALADSTAYLRGRIIWRDGSMMGLNIYITGTDFTVALWKAEDEANFMFIPSIPLLIGLLCKLIRDQQSYHTETALTVHALSHEEAEKATAVMSAAETDEFKPECCLFFESLGTKSGWSDCRYIIATDGAEKIVYSESVTDHIVFRETSLAEALAPMNRKILEIHTENIIKSGELDEKEYRMKVKTGEE